MGLRGAEAPGVRDTWLTTVRNWKRGTVLQQVHKYTSAPSGLLCTAPWH